MTSDNTADIASELPRGPGTIRRRNDERRRRGIRCVFTDDAVQTGVVEDHTRIEMSKATTSPGSGSHVSNDPTEAVNNLVKGVKRIAFGMRNFVHYRIRSLLYAGKPNRALLNGIIPARNRKNNEVTRD